MGGLAIVKPKDYELGGITHASTPYAAWKALAADNQSLRPGDLLEVLSDNPSLDTSCGETSSGSTSSGDTSSGGTLLIAKYIGFEPAQWFTPDPKPDVSAEQSSVANAVQLST